MNQVHHIMHTFRLLLLTGIFFVAFTACKKDTDTPAPTASSQTDLLIANNWRVSSITTPDGQIINPNRLDVVTQSLFTLNMQFRNNGSVRALDPTQANSAVNGGSWTLAADNQSIDVDVTGFKGNFPIIQLTKNKLILRQNAPVDGKKTDINLVFDPSL
ncbi:hypothetical protein [Spirosoma koreense]